jgi:hypothetical protein
MTSHSSPNYVPHANYRSDGAGQDGRRAVTQDQPAPSVKSSCNSCVSLSVMGGNRSPVIARAMDRTNAAVMLPMIASAIGVTQSARTVTTIKCANQEIIANW